jgi:hypothetical protein
VEFKGVAVGLAQLNHVQGRRDLENLQASGSFFLSFQSKAQAPRTAQQTMQEV